ncbi:class I SAM-dependent methyltransferase [Pontibacter akesuensis]|uniref:Methyltransferase domain-containing protein n=1 Tax=Pontibacter akesuensis TaxID=388950 RepID=A0A1I7I7B2_9BACT|nr:class I SAM-dependent methyltransferase [Pontibacter akesuensis]GHA65577.1 methyltransferase [Pontibacter akesuensis]SFU68791.1 Methyltransferase domain-containing protein [Pontibacter akesuensis]
MKDNFSGHAADYAKYRPEYPQELITYLVSLAPAHQLAWDCATGNGQVAGMLSAYFAEVVATDISEKQLQNAVQQPNITYKVEQAEQSSLADASVDLVVVAQAVHWFEFEKFYQQVKRVLRQEGVLALIGYGLIHINPAVDEVIQKLYGGILEGYWDPERRYIDEAYRTIPFPFQELDMPPFEIKYNWTLETLLGYLNTWSAVKHYERQQGQNPVQLIEQELREKWGQQKQQEVKFNIIARIGKV